LIKDDLTINVEANNGITKSDIFTIQLTVWSDEKEKYSFEPYLSFVTLMDGATINAKCFPCSYTPYDLSTFRSDHQVINKPVKISENFCYYLFFDCQPPSIDDKYTLKVNGLTKDNIPIDIPELSFSKGERRRGF